LEGEKGNEQDWRVTGLEGDQKKTGGNSNSKHGNRKRPLRENGGTGGQKERKEGSYGGYKAAWGEGRENASAP